MRTSGFARAAVRCRVATALLAIVFAAAGCGYHVAGRDSTLPEGWKEIAIPAFKSDTTQYRIEQVFTGAVIREFISRTKYRVIQNAQDADGVLHGEILSIETSPILFDATTGEVRTMLVTVHVRIELDDVKTQKPVFENKDMVFRQEYQISSDVQSFFQEESPALERMSRDFAQQVVSSVMEQF
ncbi:MAG: LPS assembly lipoprotein LptE [Candidatus Acidiferrales bacterium]